MVYDENNFGLNLVKPELDILLCSPMIIFVTISGEQTSSTSDINPVLDQTLSCLEIKIDFDEMDNLIDAGEEKIHPLNSKFISKDSKNIPGSKDLNEISPGTLENLSNPSSSTVTTVKEEELDSKGKYHFLK